MNHVMASLLGIVAAPALAQHDRTIERAEAVLNFLHETGLPEALSALPVFYGLDANIDHRIEDAFRRRLSVGDRLITPAAVNAVDNWLTLSKEGQTSPLPDVLRDRALRALERGRIGGLSHLVYLARRLIEADRCGPSELNRITEVLDELGEATVYGPSIGDADMESDRAVSIPIIRAECARLAQALARKGGTTEPIRAWRDLADQDPLPEVRNAAIEATDE